MGREEVDKKQPSLLSRACRFPRKVAGRVSEISDSFYKEHLKANNYGLHVPINYLALAILLLTYLPSILMLNYAIPPVSSVDPGSKVSSDQYYTTIHIPTPGLNHAVLENDTPFNSPGAWEIDTYWSELEGYDINRYTAFKPDGYYLEFRNNEIDDISFRKQMQIPLFNYSDVSISIELEGISGNASIYLEVFADQKSQLVEADINQNETITVNAFAPLIAARNKATSWLSTIWFGFTIGSSSGAQVILRSILIDANFTTELSPVKIALQSTENISLFSTPSMKYLESPPKIILIMNNDTDSYGVISPSQVDNIIYLAPGNYTGLVFWDWNDYYFTPPDPTNATTWAPNLNFTVVENSSTVIDIHLFVIRLDIELSHRVLLSSFRIYFNQNYQYSFSSDILGSTLSDYYLTSFYIPGDVDSITVTVDTWSAFSPRISWSWRETQHFEVRTDISLDANSSSRNLNLNIVFPYLVIGNMLLGTGDILLFAIEGILIIWFVVILKRELRRLGRRLNISDSRMFPVILLLLGVFLPWSMQLQTYSSSSYDVVYWISWFSKPFMIRWTDSTSLQLLCSTSDWWYSSLISTFLLFLPLIYVCLTIVQPEKETLDRTFAFALLLPYLVVYTAFIFGVVTLETISIGPLLILAALPVYLIRIAFRRVGLTK